MLGMIFSDLELFCCLDLKRSNDFHVNPHEVNFCLPFRDFSFSHNDSNQNVTAIEAHDDCEPGRKTQTKVYVFISKRRRIILGEQICGVGKNCEETDYEHYITLNVFCYDVCTDYNVEGDCTYFAESGEKPFIERHLPTPLFRDSPLINNYTSD